MPGDSPSHVSRFIWPYTLAASLVAISVVIGAYVVHFVDNGISGDPGQWGQFGDYAGGLLGALFAFLAMLLVLHTSRENAASAVRAAESAERTAEALVRFDREQRVSNLRAELARAAANVQRRSDSMLHRIVLRDFGQGLIGAPKEISLAIALDSMKEAAPWARPAIMQIIRARPSLHFEIMTALHYQADLAERYMMAGEDRSTILKSQLALENTEVLAYLPMWPSFLARELLVANRPYIYRIMSVLNDPALANERIQLFPS